MTSTPAPSDSTKPSRSRSHGRLALVGSSLRVDIARAEQKPPTAVPTVEYSAPPAIITSASPYWIMRIARPMLCVAVVHAVTQAMFGPLRPSMIERLPDAMLTIELGTKNGEILRCPDSWYVIAVF